MKHTTHLFAAATIFAACSPALAADEEEGFVSLFDGESFDGWKIAERPDAFKIEDGAIVAHGDRAHAFYTGDVEDAEFEDFELRMDVMTKPNANGGIFIHTTWQEEGWPGAGYEVQVNNTQGDWRKSGGLYGVVDNREPFEDDTWMKYVIRVDDGVISISINDKTIVDEYEPEDDESKLQEDGGTIALQAHDSGSTIYYKNIRIKPLD